MRILPVFLLTFVLGTVLLTDVRTLRQAQSTKLWVTYSLLFLFGSVTTLLSLLRVRLPNPFPALTTSLISISKWLMIQ